MKNSFLLSAAILFSCAAHSQVKIEADSASKHIGEYVTICSKVYGVKTMESSKMTFIDLGAKYPYNPVTIVISAKSRDNFAIAPETMYSGKNICITGTIISYKGKTEIEVTAPAAVTVE